MLRVIIAKNRIVICTHVVYHHNSGVKGGPHSISIHNYGDKMSTTYNLKDVDICVDENASTREEIQYNCVNKTQKIAIDNLKCARNQLLSIENNISSKLELLNNAQQALADYSASQCYTEHLTKLNNAQKSVADLEKLLTRATQEVSRANDQLFNHMHIGLETEAAKLSVVSAIDKKNSLVNDLKAAQNKLSEAESVAFTAERKVKAATIEYNAASAKKSKQTSILRDLDIAVRLASEHLEQLSRDISWEVLSIRKTTITHHMGTINIKFYYNSDDDYMAVIVSGVPNLESNDLQTLFENVIYPDTSNAFIAASQQVATTASGFEHYNNIIGTDPAIYIDLGDFGEDAEYFTQSQLDMITAQIANYSVVQNSMDSMSPEYAQSRNMKIIEKELQLIEAAKDAKRGYFAREQERAEKAAIVIRAREEFFAIENAKSVELVDGKEMELRWHFTNSRECSFMVNGIAITVNFSYMSKNNTIRATLSGYTTDIGGDLLLNAFNKQYSTKSAAFFLDPIDANAIIIDCKFLGMEKKDFTLKVLQDIVKNCKHAIKKA